MLKCHDVALHSSDFIEGQLPLRLRIAMRLHLMLCRHCRRFIRHLRRAVAFFHAFPVGAISREEAEAIASEVERTAL